MAHTSCCFNILFCFYFVLKIRPRRCFSLSGGSSCSCSQTILLGIIILRALFFLIHQLRCLKGYSSNIYAHIVFQVSAFLLVSYSPAPLVFLRNSEFLLDVVGRQLLFLALCIRRHRPPVAHARPHDGGGYHAGKRHGCVSAA